MSAASATTLRRLPAQLSASIYTQISEAWAGMDRQARMLTWCVGFSVVLHALLLSIHFKFPEALKFSSTQPLEVILVNAKTKEKPSKRDAITTVPTDA